MPKFHKHTIDGEFTPVDAQLALGEAASAGTVLRVETRGGQTHVWTATPDKAAGSAAGPGKGSDKVKVVEVAESDVTKIE